VVSDLILANPYDVPCISSLASTATAKPVLTSFQYARRVKFQSKQIVKASVKPA
jgi:hypothetical protein